MIVRNKLVVICVVYTAITIFGSILNLALGGVYDSYEHLLVRFIFVLLGIGSLIIFEWLEKRSYYVVVLLHYLATQSLVFIFLWGYGFFTELHPDAYRDAFFNYTAVYIAVASFFIIRHNILLRRAGSGERK